MEERELKIWERALAVIRRKIDEATIKKDFRGNKYITATKAIELLNEAFGPENWSNKIDYKDVLLSTVERFSKKSNKMISVNEYAFFSVITIVLPGRIVTGSGSCSAEWDQVDTGFKGASSEAFKKALTHIGFFMELYPDSINNPLKWKEANTTALKTVSEESKRINRKASELIRDWSEFKWGSPAVYYNADHISYLYPTYLEEFIEWMKCQ
jgi:hypothetical protein